MNQIENFRAIGVLNRVYTTYMSNAIEGKDISYSDSIFLLNIGANEGIRQERLSELLVVDKAAVARSVKSMEHKKYVRTLRNRNDARVKEIYLTESGMDLFTFLSMLNDTWLKEIMKPLSSEEIEKLNQLLSLLENEARSFRN